MRRDIGPDVLHLNGPAGVVLLKCFDGAAERKPVEAGFNDGEERAVGCGSRVNSTRVGVSSE